MSHSKILQSIFGYIVEGYAKINFSTISKIFFLSHETIWRKNTEKSHKKIDFWVLRQDF